MIGYTTIGSSDLERSAAFYEPILSALGASRAFAHDKAIAWAFGNGQMVMAHLPYDGKAQTIGNGSMVALSAPDSATVDQLYAKAMELGGTDEGAPGARSENFYAAYFRDPDGNKLNLHCMS